MKHSLYFVNPRSQRVEIRFGVVGSQRGAGGGGNSEAFHGGLRAMVPGADGDAVHVEQSADVMRMHAVERETEAIGYPLGTMARAKDRATLDNEFIETLKQRQ